ncbi:SUPPRESSOR OF GAMMA RESPONSE 1 [Trifolium repens]|nr:SUPPRESSOR OF GAMMA RESPONSE 1 [Trifolium repens]
MKDCGAYCECPNCHYRIDNSDVSWPGLPLGTKFDPSDVELLEHLAAKCGVGNREPHMFIEEFIPTLEGDQGIYYTHPENLPVCYPEERVQKSCFDIIFTTPVFFATIHDLSSNILLTRYS